MAANKSIHAIIARIDNRITYGLIRDKFELASPMHATSQLDRLFMMRISELPSPQWIFAWL
jgi:hypothetical protein